MLQQQDPRHAILLATVQESRQSRANPKRLSCTRSHNKSVLRCMHPSENPVSHIKPSCVARHPLTRPNPDTALSAAGCPTGLSDNTMLNTGFDAMWNMDLTGSGGVAGETGVGDGGGAEGSSVVVKHSCEVDAGLRASASRATCSMTTSVGVSCFSADIMPSRHRFRAMLSGVSSADGPLFFSILSISAHAVSNEVVSLTPVEGLASCCTMACGWGAGLGATARLKLVTASCHHGLFAEPLTGTWGVKEGGQVLYNLTNCASLTQNSAIPGHWFAANKVTAGVMSDSPLDGPSKERCKPHASHFIASATPGVFSVYVVNSKGEMEV